MKRYDVVLLHPPSIYDFRQRPGFYGPLADAIPSSPVFEMYPLGFITLATYLRRHGYRVRIVNLAVLMMRDPDFDVERFLRGIRPALFGIDLHWLPHVHGSLEVARLAKRIHPDVPTVFGGISATYFHEQLIRNPQVDFVLRGSVCEPSLLALVRQVQGAGNLAAVPGLTWKDGSAVRVNPDSPGPHRLDEFGLDLGMMVRQVVGHLDFWSNIPFRTWWQHPITAVFTVRGCGHECVTCGAAGSAFRRFMGTGHPFRRTPEGIADQVRNLARLSRAPIFFVGDLLDGGLEHAMAVVDALARRPVRNRLTFEFFSPPPESFVRHLDRSLRHWAAELSPESHDEAIRARMGKARYSNAELEQGIATLLASRCEQLDLFLMIGLPGQTYGSVMADVEFVDGLFARFDRRLSAFITPLGPFLDPGSAAFEHPAENGYRVFARTLEEHRQLLEHGDWERMLSYETEWMTRRELVDATYDAAEGLNAAKQRSGRLAPATAARVSARIAMARDLRNRLRQIGDGAMGAEAQAHVLSEIRASVAAPLSDKRELFPPATVLTQFRPLGIAGLLLQDLLHPARSS